MARRIRSGFNDRRWRARIRCLGVFVDHHPFESQGTFYGCGAVFRIGRDDLCTDNVQVVPGDRRGSRRVCFRCPDCGMRNELPEAWENHFTGLPNANDWLMAHPNVPRGPIGHKPRCTPHMIAP